MTLRANRCHLIGLAVLFCASSSHAQPSRDRFGETNDTAYDKVVNDFIRFDIGQIRDPIAIERIKARFGAMKGDDSVPALVRGLNESTRMRASCPITALSTKLRGVINASKDPEVGTFVLQNLERNNIGQYTQYVNSVFGAAEAQVARTMTNGLAEQRFKQRARDGLQRMAHVPGLKVKDLPRREFDESGDGDSERQDRARNQSKRSGPTRSIGSRTNVPEPGASPEATADLSKLELNELVARLTDRAAQLKVLSELSRRASAGDESKIAAESDSIVLCLKNGDDQSRESAARLLGLVRSQKAIEQLIDALDDSNARVRSAAATALTRITRQIFGPNDDASAEERQVAITRWRDWWLKAKK